MNVERTHEVARQIAPTDLHAIWVRLRDPGSPAGSGSSRSASRARSSSSTRRAPSTIAFSFAEGELAREVLHATVGRHDEPLRWKDRERPTDTTRDNLRGLCRGVTEVEDAEHDDLVRNVAEHLGVEIRLRGFERDVRRGAALELAQERIPGQPVVDDVGVAEADVEDGGAFDPFERAVDRLDRVLLRRLGASLQIRARRAGRRRRRPRRGRGAPR